MKTKHVCIYFGLDIFVADKYCLIDLFQHEIEGVRDMFMHELNELMEKYQSSQEMLDDLQRKQGKNNI
jgi:hypothetical protein